MEENFVGHLLGALDPVTEARTKAHLRANPEARARLELVREALAPLEADADVDPPPGLVQSTLAFIAEHTAADGRLESTTSTLPCAPAPSRHQVGGPVWWMRPVDWAAAAALLVLVGGLGAPFLVRQWREQQRLACADNLRSFWVSLSAYAGREEGRFPQVEHDGPRGVAGIFVPTLTDCGLAADVSIACPARGRREPLPYTVAELERLAEETPDEYRVVARDLAGHYAYSLGYQNGGRLEGLRRDSGDGLPILADAAGEPGCNSPNHAGHGQNVLYVGGQVRWCVSPGVGLAGDHIYVNHVLQVQAGMCKIDTVLGPSHARPYAGE